MAPSQAQLLKVTTLRVAGGVIRQEPEHKQGNEEQHDDVNNDFERQHRNISNDRLPYNTEPLSRFWRSHSTKRFAD
jgi:hypothetical protein